MNRSGCKNCPVKPCETLYRGSICLSRRHKLGLGDPMTNADSIRAMSDAEPAKLLCCTGWRMFEYKECLEWLKKPAEDDKNGV